MGKDTMSDTLQLSQHLLPSKRPSFRGVFRFARRTDVPFLVAGSILITLSAVASPMQTIIYGKVFDRLASFMKGDYASVEAFLRDLRVLIGAMMGIAGGRLLFAWLGITVWLVVGENTQMNARQLLFESLLSKDIEWLGTKENLIGSLTVFFRCIEEIRSGISENLGLLVQTVASVCCLFVIAMISSWSLTLVICCSIPLSALSSYVFGTLTAKYATVENLQNAQASKVLDWCFVCGATVRVLNGKLADLVHFSKIVDASAIAYTHLAFAISANTAVLKLLSNLVVIGGLAFGQHLVKTGQLGLGNVITAFSACVLLGSEISSVGDIVALLNKAQASSHTIDTLDFDENAPEIEPSASAVSDVSCFSQKIPCVSVTLTNIGFTYRNTTDAVLKNVNISFQSSHLNFLVGESGSGKSTVASLIAGFLKKTEGNLFVDGCNYESLAPDWFTENTCFVESRPLVFERSLAENLLLGTQFSLSEHATQNLLAEACAFADLEDFVAALPQKLDTVLVSSELSGGQIQKIGLARAWIANRPILILDEALGSINSKAKSAIMQRIRHWRKGTLTIIVSHDLTDLEGNDNVVVMANGRVKASGQASELRSSLPRLTLGSPKGSNVKIETEKEVIEYQERGASLSGLSRNDSSQMGPELSAHRSPQYSKTSLTAFQSKIPESPPSYDYLNNPAILRDLESQTSPNSPEDTSVEMTSPMGLGAVASFCLKTAGNKVLILLGLVCALLGGVATPGLSYCFAEVLSIIIKSAAGSGQSNSSVVTWSVIIVGVSAADSAVTFGSHMSLEYAAETWILALRKRCLARINDQDMAFFGTARAARLTTLLMNDTRDLRNLVSQFLPGVLLVGSLTGLGLVWAVVIGWKLALVGVAFVPLVFLVTLTYSALLQKYETAYKDQVADTEKFTHEVVAAMRTVHSFGLSRQLSAEHSAKLRLLYKAGCKRAVAGGFGIALAELCSTSATATVLYYGMSLVVRRQYTEKQMVQVLTMLTFTVASAAYLMKSLPEVTRGQRAATLISRLLALPESPAECSGSEKRIKGHKSEPQLEFSHVSFAYTDASAHTCKRVLEDASLRIYSGESVVIAGACGSGKSTIASLALRLYAQDRGTVRYRGTDIQDLDPDWYRSQVGLVGQEPAFFEASIGENLLYGLTGATRARAEAALPDYLHAVNASEFVSRLPSGLDTILGPESSFSSGQLQRLAIARVLVRQPKVIVFDEPTSRLDSENSDWISTLVLSELQKLDPSLTTIVISHDPRVMARASRVLMVHQGRVVEDGSFEKLIEKGGVFADFMK